MANLDKEAKVEEIAERLGRAKAVVVADYRGLKVSEMADLRANLRELGVEFKIYKNTLLRLAAGKAGIEGLDDYLTGPTGLALAYEDPLAAAQVLSKYAKTTKVLKLKGGLLEGKAITGDQVKAVAALPSKEVLIAQLIGGMQSPMYGLVSVLNGPIRGLAAALSAIASQKQA